MLSLHPSRVVEHAPGISDRLLGEISWVLQRLSVEISERTSRHLCWFNKRVAVLSLLMLHLYLPGEWQNDGLPLTFWFLDGLSFQSALWMLLSLAHQLHPLRVEHKMWVGCSPGRPGES